MLSSGGVSPVSSMSWNLRTVWMVLASCLSVNQASSTSRAGSGVSVSPASHSPPMMNVRVLLVVGEGCTSHGGCVTYRRVCDRVCGTPLWATTTKIPVGRSCLSLWMPPPGAAKTVPPSPRREVLVGST